GMRFDTSRPNEENAELLLYAYSKGVNYFDTAPQYCEDKSEDIFGIALKEMAQERDKFYVSTKGMPEKCDTADKAREGVCRSLERLNVDKIDFYHVWCIRRMQEYALAMKKGGQYEGLLRCKEEGLIDHIAISTHLTGEQIRSFIGKKEFDGMLLGVNALNFLYRWDGVAAACEAGVGVVAMNPLCGGMIPQHEKSLGFLGGQGESPTEAALRFCISCPQITVTLNGFTTKEHIDTACGLAENRQEFSESEIEKLKVHLCKSMDSLCTGCGYCLGVCPQDIPVANYMQCYNEKALFGKSGKEMADQMKFHHEWGLLANNKANSEACTECKECEKVCTQHLSIIERLGEIAGWEKGIKS
ncbi:MAG: aldo/keto reductase, partial [Planctomycetota bacterium]